MNFFLRPAVLAAAWAVCAFGAAAQTATATVHIDNGTQASDLRPAGTAPSVSEKAPNIQTTVGDGAGNVSQVLQMAEGIQTAVMRSQVVVRDASATQAHWSPTGWTPGSQGFSAAIVRDDGSFMGNAADLNNDNSAVQDQLRNGTLTHYDAAQSTNTVQTGSFDARNRLSTGLRSDGTAGSNYILGDTTLTNSLTVEGATTTHGLTNTGHIATTTVSTTGDATVGGKLDVAGTTTTHGLGNTGQLATSTWSSSGDARVDGDFSVTGSSSTQGLGNTGHIATTTLSTGGHASVGGDFAVLGQGRTQGLANTGDIATTSLSSSGNANVGGSLGVTGAMATSGLSNTGHIATTRPRSTASSAWSTPTRRCSTTTSARSTRRRPSPMRRCSGSCATTASSRAPAWPPPWRSPRSRRSTPARRWAWVWAWAPTTAARRSPWPWPRGCPMRCSSASTSAPATTAVWPRAWVGITPGKGQAALADWAAGAAASETANRRFY